VHPQHVVRDLAVLLGVHLIQDDEEEVKTRQQRVLEADVLHGGFVLVVLHETRERGINTFRGGGRRRRMKRKEHEKGGRRIRKKDEVEMMKE